MGFWLFMLLFVLLIPLTMIYFGRRFFREPPASINAAFGYRSTMSMKNQETWKLARTVCGPHPVRDRAQCGDDRVCRVDHRIPPARPDALRAPGHGTRAAEKV